MTQYLVRRMPLVRFFGFPHFLVGWLRPDDLVIGWTHFRHKAAQPLPRCVAEVDGVRKAPKLSGQRGREGLQARLCLTFAGDCLRCLPLLPVRQSLTYLGYLLQFLGPKVLTPAIAAHRPRRFVVPIGA